MRRFGPLAPGMALGLALALLLPSVVAAKGGPGGGIPSFKATGSQTSTTCSPFSANVTASWTGGTITQVVFELIYNNNLSQPAATDQVLVTFKQSGMNSYSVNGQFTGITTVPNATNVEVSAKYYLKGSTVPVQWSAFSILGNCTADLQVGSVALTPTADPNSYTIHVVNAGNVDVDINGMSAEGYYNTIDTYAATSDPACGTTVVGSTIVPVGGSYDLLVPCSLAPSLPGDTWLVVGINQDNLILESNSANDTGGLNLIISETPNPLVFPNATVGSGACGAVGSTSCTYASITITNDTTQTQTITTASAGTAIFWPTYGGTCNVTYKYMIPSGSSCTFEFGFEPTAVSTTYTDTGTVSFASGAALSFGLSGTSNAAMANLIVSAITIDAPVNGVYYWTATIENIGTASADVAKADVQGYYSVDTILDRATDTLGCGSIISGSSLTLAPGASTDVLVGCGTFPAATDNYLIVEVDHNQAVTESNYSDNVSYVHL